MPAEKTLTRAGYLVALMLFALPIADTVIALWPIQAGDEQWRFGATGTLSTTMLLPVIGLLGAVVIARWNDHEGVRKTLGRLSLALAIVFSLAGLLFVLDFFQTRAMVAPTVQRAVTVAAVTSLIKQALTITALIFIGRAAAPVQSEAPRKSSGSRRSKHSKRASDDYTPLIPVSGDPRVS